jgi:Xaa-Pro aminopeptidase
VTTSEKLAALREKLPLYGIAGIIQPVHDEFMSEYPPACYQRVARVTGFTGSAGTLVVLQDKAALFVDGRYTLQAAAEIDTALVQVINSGDVTPEQWLAEELKNTQIGYDANLFTPNMIERAEKALEKSSVQLVPCPNLVDAVWTDRPAEPATRIFLHDEKFAGETASSKRLRIAALVKKQGAEAALLTAPESVCWLLNIRASDVECTPLLLARAIIHADSTVEIFTDPVRLPRLADVTAYPASEMKARIRKLSRKTVLCDYAQISMSVRTMLDEAKVNIINATDPCLLPKACKNIVQIAGIREAHIRDGAAIVKLLRWIDNHPNIETVSEMDVADKLLGFRKQGQFFVEPSFPTIAGSGPNGAIVHYRATEKTNRKLKRGELLLLDSGGQYPDGTTDITRTIAIGEPSAEHKDRFTRILKGHIAIATATFPEGTPGSLLDPLARAPLKEIGLDYDHGTGHGVGQFLGVHEGPQRISKRAGDVPLEVGMVVSNEPGYYKTGEYGIRIENLVVVVEKEDGILGFETLTCAPIDKRLVDESMLTADEKRWLDDYHAWVERGLTGLL